jgi:hypothetical protein
MDLRNTGATVQKRAHALALKKKLVTLRAFSYSPFWEDIHERWAYVFTPDCNLADAIEEFLGTVEDLIAGVVTGACTPGALHFPAECIEDLVAAYGLSDPWKNDLYDVARRLDSITITPEGAAALVRRTIPQLQERLADERRRSE